VTALTASTELPRLVWPMTNVREAYLAGERADCELCGTPTAWVGPAAADFEAFVAVRRGVRTR